VKKLYGSRKPFMVAAYTLKLILTTGVLLLAVRVGDPLLIGLALASLVVSAWTSLAAAHAYDREIRVVQGWINALVAGRVRPEQGLREDKEVAEQLQSLLNTTDLTLPEFTGRNRPRPVTLITQTRFLSVLYDVAAGVNVSSDLDDLLERFLGAISKVTDTRAVAVRLLDEDQQLVLAAHVGLEELVTDNLVTVPVEGTCSGRAIRESKVIWQDDGTKVTFGAGKSLMEDNPELLMVSVPLQYRSKTVGVYNIFVDRHQIIDREPLEALFMSIGRHLGIAIEKTRLEREAYELHIIQERSRFSEELHDSIAQTIASLRFQVRVLEDGLDNGNDPQVRTMLQRIERGVADANTELRELIAHFRAPIGTRGLIPALQTAVDKFKEESGAQVFFQSKWDHTPLAASEEMQVLRIVQESLANIRKYAKASAVRVFLSSAGEHLLVLIEDDGEGFDTETSKDSSSGNHLGLGIMTSRAEQLGGELTIDSDPGEGTRITLKFIPQQSAIDDQTRSAV